MNLNEFQRRAVEYTDGPVLVLAGPGSGKTATIIERIKYLVNSKKCKSQRILVVTFTKAAAKEMSERYFKSVDSSMESPMFATIHALCYEIIRKKKGIPKLVIQTEQDLEKLIRETLEIFGEDGETLTFWQSKYDYILIDEFQDTSIQQAEILFQLAGNKKNVMVVGDDDQSIYGFRGGTPEVFSIFLDRFPNAGKIQLKVNYRSKEEIIRSAESFISHNPSRMCKEAVLSGREESGKEGTIRKSSFENQWEQMECIVQEIHRLESQMSYKDIAVLFRAKVQFRIFLICAKIHALPVCCKDKERLTGLFFIEDICSYIKVIRGVATREDYIKIINKPNRNIDRNYLDKEQVNEEEWFYRVKEVDREEGRKVGNFLDEIGKMRCMPLYLSMCHLLYHIGYKDYLIRYWEKNEMGMDRTVAEKILQEVLTRAKQLGDFKKFCDYLEEDIGSLEHGVSVMTMHASKGLEFDTVFLPDLNEDIIPNKKAVQTSGIEEERRLFYVALTRAKNLLYLSWVTSKNNMQVKSSSFLDELII